MKPLKKLKPLSEQDLRCPSPYLSTLCLEEARMAVRLDTFMLDCSNNMKNKYVGRMVCEACLEGVIETQEHLELCDGYAHIREKYDMYKIEDKVKFFGEVMMARAKSGRV